MAEPLKQLLLRPVHWLSTSFQRDFKTFTNGLPNQIKFWALAILVGTISGLAAIGFKQGIQIFQSLFYGSDEIRSFTEIVLNLNWYWKLLIPMVGGLIVGLILHFFTDDGRAKSVADVIQDVAVNNGKIDKV